MFLCTASLRCPPRRAAFIFLALDSQRERERSERGDRSKGQGVCAVCSQYGRLVATFVCHFYCYAKGFPKHFKSKNPTFYDRMLGNWTVLTLQWTISPRRAVKSDSTHTHTESTQRTVLTGNGNWNRKLEMPARYLRALASPSGQLSIVLTKVLEILRYKRQQTTDFLNIFPWFAETNKKWLWFMNLDGKPELKGDNSLACEMRHSYTRSP